MRRVVLFPTCLPELVRPDAARAAERVLRRAGCAVEVRAGATCCGQVAWNSGHVDDARRVATGTVDALSGGEDPVVLCSGSCTTMVTHFWPEMFAGTRRAGAARAVARRARELSTFLAHDVGADALPPMSARSTVTYHDSCHMLRTLGERDAPRALLGAVDGLELREMGACERCCGFGGTFALRYPELSAAMADEKVDDAARTGAETVVASDLGCLMQIEGRARARGVPLRGAYVAEVLDAAAEDDTG